MDSAVSMREWLKQLIADVYTGKVDPKVATALTPLLNLHMRALEIAAIEEANQRLKASDTRPR